MVAAMSRKGYMFRIPARQTARLVLVLREGLVYYLKDVCSGRSWPTACCNAVVSCVCCALAAPFSLSLQADHR